MGADVNLQDNDKMTAMDYAIRYADTEMEQILSGADVQECQIHDIKDSYFDISDLGLAALNNDVDAVDGIIKKVCMFCLHLYCHKLSLSI